MNVKCDTCGKSFDKKSCKIGANNFCTRKCLGVANGNRSRKSHLTICDFCGKEFVQTNRHSRRNKHFYCSTECGWAAKVKKVSVVCDWCGTQYEKKRSDVARTAQNLCSRGCYQDFINFEKAGAKNQKVAGAVLYRRLVEMKLGRTLTVDEEVHHKDGDHGNNKPENLMLVTKSEHMALHAAMKRRGSNGQFICQE